MLKWPVLSGELEFKSSGDIGRTHSRRRQHCRLLHDEEPAENSANRLKQRSSTEAGRVLAGSQGAVQRIAELSFRKEVRSCRCRSVLPLTDLCAARPAGLPPDRQGAFLGCWIVHCILHVNRLGKAIRTRSKAKVSAGASIPKEHDYVTDLKALTLGAAKPRLPLEIRENPNLALTSLALRRGGSEPTPLRMHLPGPGRWVSGQAVAALWTGPDQWMIEAERRAEQDFATELQAIRPGCSVTGRPMAGLLSRLYREPAQGLSRHCCRSLSTSISWTLARAARRVPALSI